MAQDKCEQQRTVVWVIWDRSESNHRFGRAEALCS